MKQFWTDLKSCITILMIVLLFIVVIANLFGKTLADNLLILVTNLITAVFTYYFAKRENNEGSNENGRDKSDDTN